MSLGGLFTAADSDSNALLLSWQQKEETLEIIFSDYKSHTGLL